MLVPPPIANITEEFQRLQAQLRDRWPQFASPDTSSCDILVIPSISLDQDELTKIRGVHHYEERLLYFLIRLQNPRTRLIYVTSQPIHPSIIDYYLELLHGVPFSHARDRLLLLSVYDSSPRSLSEKLLCRPRLMERIRQAMRPNQSYMVCYNSSPWERQLSVALDLPLFALDPALLHWGTKSGSRRIFADSGVPHPDGSQLVYTVPELATEAALLWERQPDLKRMVIKLDEGFSGQGNALLPLDGLQQVAPDQADHADRAAAFERAFEHLSFQSDTETWAHFSSQITQLGAITEAFVEGENKRSPSVQGRINPLGEVEILSTHDQILGGPDQQTFLGCSFPADDCYRLALQNMGVQVGEALASHGAIGRYGLDVIAVPPPADDPGQGWDLQAIEINLRMGGTTHPFMALKLLTNGRYDRTTGLFYNQQGAPKYYVASDNLSSDRYAGLLPSDLMDISVEHRLHFNPGTGTGTVFHLIGCLSEFGKLGLTSIGNSPQQAQDLYNRVGHVLDDETRYDPDLSHCTRPHTALSWRSG